MSPEMRSAALSGCQFVAAFGRLEKRTFAQHSPAAPLAGALKRNGSAFSLDKGTAQASTCGLGTAEKVFERYGRIYNSSELETASGAVLRDAESSIPNIDADFLHFTSKT